MGEAVIILFVVGWSVSFDKAVKVVDADQFFDFVLKRLTLICGVVVVLVIFAVLGHIGIEWVQGFVWWWDEVRLEGFIEKP